MERWLKKGEGWRIGWNPEAEIYKGLVGGEDWAFELTEEEFKDFRRLLNQLSQSMTEMAEELMDSERIACEAETDLLWMEVEGFPHAYSLRLILNQGRACEGNWAADFVKELVEAARMLTIF